MPDPQVPQTEPQVGQQEAPQPPDWQALMQQREMQFMQAMAANAQVQQQYEQALWQQHLQSLPEEQREPADQWYGYLRGVQATVQQAEWEKQQALAYAQQLERATMPLVQREVFNKMSQQHKIEADILRLASTPQEAELIAKAIQRFKERANFEQRKTNGNDQAPSPSFTSFPAGDSSAAKKAFAGTGNIQGYLAALRKAR